MTAFVPSLQSARQYYADLEMEPLPLHAGTKQAAVSGWQKRSSDSLWMNIKDEYNIGIRCGGSLNLAVIDCDDKNQPGTYENVSRYLQGLGFMPGNAPIVKTASGMGRHIYIRVNKPIQGDWHLLTDEMGAGELRFGRGSYVVAPPSAVGNPYQLIAGDFRQIPQIAVPDLVPIAGKLTPAENSGKNISRLAWRLLAGDVGDGYPSRSEADQALITSLVNTGHGYEDILHLFQTYPTSGKFNQLWERNPRQATGYLKHSFERGKTWSTNNVSPGRQLGKKVIQWASSRPWPGRTGVADRNVLLAHAKIAEECGKVVYAASSRDLAELAGCTHRTASHATKRLIEAGLIRLEVPATASLAAKYSLQITLQ